MNPIISIFMWLLMRYCNLYTFLKLSSKYKVDCPKTIWINSSVLKWQTFEYKERRVMTYFLRVCGMYMAMIYMA